MALSNLYKGARIIETIENYSLVEDSTLDACADSEDDLVWFYTDREFWSTIINNPQEFWNKKISLRDFILSPWIARIPGLYWADYSKKMREHDAGDIARESKDWIEFYPPGKSKKVLGGIGTIMLPPNDDGKRLMSICSGANSSLGIPILIYPDVFDALSLKTGDLLTIKSAKWQSMSIEWSKRFPTTNGIPRGCLIVDKPDQLKVLRKNLPVVYHPFSIMEYETENTYLYDFVFCTIDTKVISERKDVGDFFDYYAKKDQRNGKYLINPNLVEPMFETVYFSPSDLNNPIEKANLNLLYQRVRKVTFNNISLNLLLEQLPHYFNTPAAIRTLASNIGIPAAFIVEGSAATMSAFMINYCLEKNITEMLIDRILFEYPMIFK